MPVPRGLRRNNPLNLVHAAKNKWQGLADPPSDGRFCRFVSPAFGIRAAALNLIAYQDRHGLRTIAALIERWAPFGENDTAAYIADVAGRSGLGAAVSLDLHSYAHLRPVIEAMIWHENGEQPYDTAVIDEGLRRAGVIADPAPLARTTAGRGGQIAAASTAANVGLEAAGQIIGEAREALAPAVVYVDCLKWALLALTLIGVGMMLWPLVKGRRLGVA